MLVLIAIAGLMLGTLLFVGWDFHTHHEYAEALNDRIKKRHKRAKSTTTNSFQLVGKYQQLATRLL